jgi:hypothetical protein
MLPALCYCGTDLPWTDREAAVDRQFLRASRNIMKTLVAEVQSDDIIDVFNIVRMQRISHRRVMDREPKADLQISTYCFVASMIQP